MSGKPETIRAYGSAGLDQTPEQSAEKAAKALQLYVNGRVQPESHSEYLRRYLGHLCKSLPGARDALVSDWVERPEELAGMLSEGGGHEHLFRLVDELLEREPGIRSRIVGRWMDELTEDVARRAPSTESYAIVTLLQEIEAAWRQEG